MNKNAPFGSRGSPNSSLQPIVPHLPLKSAPTQTTRVLIAPDSFRGKYSAVEVAHAIAEGVQTAGIDADLCPITDGGEGSLDAIAARLGARRVTCRATDAHGRPIDATFALVERSRTAFVESASASGLDLVADLPPDPWGASSAGTGELILAAVEAGARRIILAAGGPASTDGGCGAIDVIRDGGGLRGARLTVLCNVHLAWEEVAQVFAPIKGADEDVTHRLTQRLIAFADKLPRNPRHVAMTGSGGGMAGGLWACFDAELCSGPDWMLRAVDLGCRLTAASAVITGEGRVDRQSVQGKLLRAVARHARTIGRPAYAVLGRDWIGKAASYGWTDVHTAFDIARLRAVGHAIAETVRERTFS